jgi:hypothetical protein
VDHEEKFARRKPNQGEKSSNRGASYLLLSNVSVKLRFYRSQAFLLPMTGGHGHTEPIQLKSDAGKDCQWV